MRNGLRGLAFFAVLAGYWVTPAPAAIIGASIDPGLYGHLDQRITDCPDLNCGPTSVANSLGYLQQRHPTQYGERLIPDTNSNDVIDEAELLAVANNIGNNFMGNCGCGTGTFIEDFILGKFDYIESVAPGRTVYKSQIALVWRPGTAEEPADITHPGAAKPAFVQDDTAATLAFIAREIAHGEDVEVFLANDNGAHYVTVTGIRYEDTTNVGFIDIIDPEGGVEARVAITGVTDGVIQTDYQLGGEGTSLFHAVSESAPAPPVLVLLGAGLAVVVLGRRRGR